MSVHSSCLEENDLVDLASGRLGAEALAGVEAHLDDCADCRFLLAELLEPDRVRAPSWDLPRGERVGRYIILDRVGIGGMGTVYAAYDSELGRKVALKLLHARTLDDADGGERLLREAQAMARLHHVNILSVHDIGAYGGHLFLSMDLVEGTSLRTYLQAQSATSLEEIREVFLAAGAGLYAAHRAGVVHCDFKPDNVLRRADGRICVTDFGLAWLAMSPNAGSSSDFDAQGAQARGPQGGGSLPYMAPEQLRHQPVTAASDQWSFCVALYEAIYGERPFGGNTPTAVLDAIEHRGLKLAAQRSPSGDTVPAWLQALLRRGLSARPGDRFSSMGALLDALAQRPAQRMRRIGALVVVALVLICGLAAARFIELRPLRACMAAAKAGFPHEPSPAAEWMRTKSWPELDRVLSTYRERWTAEAMRSCVDTWERHSQVAATQGLRASCARRQTLDAKALYDVLSRPPSAISAAADAETLTSRLLRFAAQLPGPDRCNAARVLLASGQSAGAACTDEPCDRGRALLARARAQRALLAHDSAQTLLTEAAQRAAHTGDGALSAEVRLEQGQLWLELDGKADRGRQTIKEALWLAMRARDEELTAICWARLLVTLGSSERPELIEEARRLLPHAQAALTRIGGDAQLGAWLAAIGEKQ